VRSRCTGTESPGRKGRRPRLLGFALTALGALAATTLAPASPAAAAPAIGSAKPASVATSHGRDLLTQAQAEAQARKTGKPVEITAATTDDSSLAANPDGTLTLTEQNMPVRKDVNGAWTALDPTLHRNADGTVSPAVTTDGLTLSGGGAGPLASLTAQGHTLSLTLPWRLPAPVLSGDTATYDDVPAPGIDLEVTADSQGDFTDVLIVKNAAAAASPALRSFAIRPSVTGGLVVRTDSHGNLTAGTRGGHEFFEIPAGTMWDSRTPAAGTVKTAMDPAVGRDVDLRDGQPLTSAAASPGEDARTAVIGDKLSGGVISYTPDQSILTGKDTDYPVYIDPPAGSTEQYWAQVDSYWPTQTYPKPNPMQVGYDGWQSPAFIARSFVRESVPSELDGSSTDVQSATLYLTDEWAPTCSTSAGDEGVQVWYTGGISSSTDWDNQPAWNTEEAEKSFVDGYSSSCPAASQGFTVTGAMTSAAHGSWSNVTFGIKADSESDEYGWKQFSDTVTLSTTFDVAPDAPGDLSTSPATSCTQSPPSTVGNGDVTLYSTLSDPLGSKAGSLTATVNVTDDATGKALSGSPFKYTGLGSGSLTTTLLTESVLKTAAGTAITEFSWNASVTDGTLTSPTSKTCNFDYDPTSPGAPTVTAVDTSYTIKKAASFDVTPNVSGVTPTSYTYQVNGAAPSSVTASGNGDATIPVTPTSGADALTVTAISAGGNVGQSATVLFTASAPANAADGDMTGDAIPDLVTPGGTSAGLAPGLWLATGEAAPGGSAGDGQLITSTVDIGSEGNGFVGDYSPNDFNGAQVTTGLFSDNGLQDALVYYPSGTYAGQGAILDGNGDGTVLDDEDAANTTAITSATFSQPDPYGDLPLEVANGYNADPNDSPAYPDLITISGDNQASGADGYYLEYYQNGGIPGYWVVSDVLSTTTPDGTMDWNDWQITTMQDPASGGVDMFLYDSQTGALYLWQNFTVNDAFDTSGYTQYELSPDWAPGTVSELRAADITGAGPALWAVTNTGTATAWLTGNLNATAGTGTITAEPAQSLLSPTHDWRLGDGSGSTASDTGDGTPLPLTMSSGATWNNGDLFSPDVNLNGTSGALTTSSQVLNTTGNWSVSAWVKPAALGGTVLSQYGAEASCLSVSIAATTTGGVTTGSWQLATTSADTSGAATVLATAGASYTVQAGVWTHLTATYDASAGFLRLYVDGVPAASASTTAVWSTGCGTFALGQSMSPGGAIGGHFNGEMADVQAWNGTAVNPTEAATMSGTPGYVLFPSDGTSLAAAASPTTWTWSTACGEMNFYQGQLTVKGTCAGGSVLTFGPGGYPGATLELQADGNLVIRNGAAVLWASNTAGNPGDTMFLQPDGNLVIYGSYGQVLWASNSATPVDGTAYVFFQGADGGLYEAQGPASGGLGTPVARDMGTLGSAPAAAVDGSGNTYVYWKGTDGNLWEAYWTGSGWAGPYNRGMGPLGSQPTVTVTPAGTAYVFWKGTNGNLYEAQGPADGALTGPVNRGMGTLGSAPSAAINSSGDTYVYWEGASGNDREAYYDGSGWAGPYDRGIGTISGTPAVTVYG
jgi:hypothetical protein